MPFLFIFFFRDWISLFWLGEGVFGDHVDQTTQTSLSPADPGISKAVEHDTTTNTNWKVCRYVSIASLYIPGIAL